jgi:DNA polymerase/3'-5' exonuclease PolX
MVPRNVTGVGITMKQKRPFNEMLAAANRVKELLAPHCYRCEIAGSIRREAAMVSDIEIVAIPKPYDVGLFESGIATVVKRWEKVKGELPCKYTQRILSDGIILDLFFAIPENWGLILAIRTGSAEFSHKILANRWVRYGYKSENGMLIKDGEKIPVQEESDLFKILGMNWIEPKERQWLGV